MVDYRLFLTVEPNIADVPATKSHIPAILGLFVIEEYYGNSWKSSTITGHGKSSKILGPGGYFGSNDPESDPDLDGDLTK